MSTPSHSFDSTKTARARTPSQFAIPISVSTSSAGQYCRRMRDPDDSSPRKSSHSSVLLIGILLTCLAMIAHRFLPERRLALDSTKDLALAWVMQSGNGAPADIQWVDQSPFHFACQFPQA